MKNAAIVLNAVLLVLVGVLFYLHFSAKKEDKAQAAGVQTSHVASAATEANFRIGYFEWDSVTNRFDLFKEIQTDINQREENNEREKARLRLQYQNKYNSYSQRQLSQTESEQAAQEMKNLEVSISNQMQRMDQELTDYRVRKQKEVTGMVEDYLKEYTKTNNYSFILADEPNLIFYRDSTFNITGDLIRGLNQKYPKKKK